MAGAAANPAAPRLSMRGVAVAYGGVPALVAGDLAVRAGEVHALLGENGAGKSTLLKALAGAVPLQQGSIELDGIPFAPRDPRAARLAGVAMIHQELTVSPHLDVVDNVLLGCERARCGIVDRRAAEAAAAAAFALLGGAAVPLRARTGALSPAQRQLVEIARALARDARVLVMDEPTSSLDDGAVAQLRRAIAQLRARGLAIVYTSHALGEVRQVATGVTVLRDGRTVFQGELAAIDDAGLLRHMAGREVAIAPRAGADRPAGEVVLRAHAVAGAVLPRAVSFELHRGEILGIGGLCGAGRSETIEVLAGLRRRVGGEVAWPTAAIAGATPAARWRARVGTVAEDRKRAGLSTGMSIAHNVVLPLARRLAGALGWLRPTAVEGAATAACAPLAVRCRGPWQRVGELSGGNQQKVAFARLLAADCDVWLLDEPTRGIDVGSRHEIYALLRDRAAAGAAVLLVSSQLQELLMVCDRIAVMRDGVLGAARPVGDWTQESLLQAAFGHEVVA